MLSCVKDDHVPSVEVDEMENNDLKQMTDISGCSEPVMIMIPEVNRLQISCICNVN